MSVGYALGTLPEKKKTKENKLCPMPVSDSIKVTKYCLYARPENLTMIQRLNPAIENIVFHVRAPCYEGTFMFPICFNFPLSWGKPELLSKHII